MLNNAAKTLNPAEGPTGAILTDLPSPYMAHPGTGLLHLPRFLAKIKKHLAGELPKSYQRNFTKGFDAFLCMHLGVEPQQVVQLMQESQQAGETDAQFNARLMAMLPAVSNINAHKWNREVVQKGMHGLSRDTLQQQKENLGIAHREDIVGFADLIEYDEGRLGT